MSKINKCILSILSCLAVFTSFSFEINAVDVGSFDMYLNEPQVNDSSGYITILLQNKSSGVYSIQVFQYFTSLSTNYDGVNNGNFVDVTLADNKISIYFSSNVETVTRGTVLWWKGASVECSNITVTSSGTTQTYSKSYTSYNIVGAQVNGSVGHIYNNLTTNNVFSVNWNGNKDYTDDIEEFINQLTSLNTSVDNIEINLSDIKTYVNNIKSNTSTIKTTLTNLYNGLSTWITTQTTTISNKIDEIKASLSEIFNSNDNINDKTNDMNDKTNEFNEIESGLVDNLQNSFENIELKNDLFNGNDFIKSSSFVATQMNTIYNSNSIIKNLITYSLIIGLAMTVIGISLRR